MGHKLAGLTQSSSNFQKARISRGFDIDLSEFRQERLGSGRGGLEISRLVSQLLVFASSTHVLEESPWKNCLRLP